MRYEAETRKKDIRENCIKLFLEKGFANVTMDDIAKICGLSRGGLYYHYSSKEDIMYEIMREAMILRLEKVTQFIKENNHLSKRQLLIETTFDKIITNNEFKSLYVMFLIECKNNESFNNLRKKMRKDSLSMLNEFSKNNDFGDQKVFEDDFIAFVIDSVYLGTEILGIKELSSKYQKHLKIMLTSYIDSNF